MTQAIAAMTTEQIVEAVGQLTNEDAISIEERVVRVNLLREYEQRMGGAAVDALMDRLGL